MLSYKRCYRCQQTLQVANFARNRSKRDGLADRCRDCKSLENRARKYGVSPEWILERLDELEYECEICHTPFHKQRAEIDHNHSNHTVRGIICKNCNLIIGFAHEDVEVLEAVIRYLNERGTR